MLNSGKKIRDKKNKYSNSCVVLNAMTYVIGFVEISCVLSIFI